MELNKPWLVLIPEFNAVLKADKGSPGDSEGRNKAKAKKAFVYIYFMINFKSPIREWEYGERHEEALRYADLQEKDVSSALVKTALDKYEELQLKAARSLRTLEAAEKAMNAFDDYMHNLDFTKTDKLGKLVHSPKEVVANMAQLNKAYDELDKFKKRVSEELKESSTIRGQATLGDKERKPDLTKSWEEATPENIHSKVSFGDMAVHLNKYKKEEVEEQEETEE